MESPDLRDYYRMDLDVLVRDYYRPRVAVYLDALRQTVEPPKKRGLFGRKK